MDRTTTPRWRHPGFLLLYAIGATIPAVILPLIVAVLLSRAGSLTRVFRSFYFLPLVTSPVAAAAVWKWMYAKDFGLINYALRKAGGQPIDWLFNLDWAMPAVIVMSVWLLLPFNTILYTAGLQEIPRDYYDAAAIDGSSAFQGLLGIGAERLKVLAGPFLIAAGVALLVSRPAQRALTADADPVQSWLRTARAACWLTAFSLALINNAVDELGNPRLRADRLLRRAGFRKPSASLMTPVKRND